MSGLILYGYWRSSCSYRVRIALNHKQLDFEYRGVHLVRPRLDVRAQGIRARNVLEPRHIDELKHIIVHRVGQPVELDVQVSLRR